MEDSICPLLCQPSGSRILGLGCVVRRAKQGALPGDPSFYNPEGPLLERAVGLRLPVWPYLQEEEKGFYRAARGLRGSCRKFPSGLAFPSNMSQDFLRGPVDLKSTCQCRGYSLNPCCKGHIPLGREACNEQPAHRH